MSRSFVTQVLEADLTWLDGTFQPGVRVAVNDAGRIAGVGVGLGGQRLPLPGLALMPGFVNAHSHAFQRALRGRTDQFPEVAGDFWTWRSAMYALVDELDASGLAEVSRQAFLEMRDAGITSVGEFHYLHHGPEGEYSLGQVVVDAAADVGIRLVLLHTAYVAGGFGKPLEPGQQRFATPDAEAFWRAADKLAAGMGDDQTLGVAGHSVRAVPLTALDQMRREAARRGLVFHMHVEEQEAEVEEAVAAHGAAPLDLVMEYLAPDPTYTAVHGTRAGEDRLGRFLKTGANLCVCPLTEANLGDGLPALPAAAIRGVPAGSGEPPSRQLCLGTDSNARISMLEEVRWLELGQRLRTGRRGVLRDESGAVAPGLLEAATRGGARALGIRTGIIAAGFAADFALIDLDSPALRGVAPADLAAAMVTGAGDEIVVGTCVAGRWRHHA